MNNSLSLGTKVICKGFLRKNNNYITHNKEDQKALCKLFNKPFKESESGYYDSLGNGVDWEEQIKVRDFIEKEFTGFICGKKKLHSTIYPTVCYESYTGNEYDVVYKDNYIDCYEVCIENKNKTWGKRYVPMDKVTEVLSNEN
jgi:hypothetical protein